MGDKADQLAQEMSRLVTAHYLEYCGTHHCLHFRFEQEIGVAAPTNNRPRPLFSSGHPMQVLTVKKKKKAGIFWVSFN